MWNSRYQLQWKESKKFLALDSDLQTVVLEAYHIFILFLFFSCIENLVAVATATFHTATS